MSQREILRLMTELQEGRLDPRALEPSARRGIVGVLMDGKHSIRDLAAILKTTRHVVEGDLKRIRRATGAAIAGWTISDAIGYLTGAAERSYAMAFEDGDAALMFTVRRDFVRQLKELGVFGRADDREGVRVTIEGLAGGYERAVEALGRSLDPVLTGERVARTIETTARPLPLGSTIAGRGGDEAVELDLVGVAEGLQEPQDEADEGDPGDDEGTEP